MAIKFGSGKIGEFLPNFANLYNMRFLTLLLALVAVSVQGFDSALFDAIDAGKTTEALELLQSVEHPDKYETFTKDNASRKRFNYSFLQ